MKRFTFAFVAVLLLSPAIGCAAEKTDARGKLVYQQDFSKADSLGDFAFASPDHWKRVKIGDRWALEHENAAKAKTYEPPYRSPYNIALIDGLKVGSFTLEYEAQQTSKEYGHRDSCVFFNFKDLSHFYYTHIATKSDPNAHQIMIVKDAPRKPITKKGTDGFDWGPVDKWHHIKVVRDVESGLIAIYVDNMDEPIMTTNDKTYTMGFVGFGSFDDTGRVTNIKLWSNNVEQGKASFYKKK
jgi:hypothetical protein